MSEQQNSIVALRTLLKRQYDYAAELEAAVARLEAELATAKVSIGLFDRLTNDANESLIDFQSGGKFASLMLPGEWVHTGVPRLIKLYERLKEENARFRAIATKTEAIIERLPMNYVPWAFLSELRAALAEAQPDSIPKKPTEPS